MRLLLLWQGIVATIIGLFLAHTAVKAQMNLHPLISSGMVLQQGENIRLTGRFLANQEIRLRFRDQEYKTVANSKGSFVFSLNAGTAGGPFPMVFTGKAGTAVYKKEIKEAYVGEVFVAGGQSNMEWSLGQLWKQARNDVSPSPDPLLRMVTVPKQIALRTTDSLPACTWQPTDTNQAKSFSAVAWYFAKHIRETQKVPVGIIACHWGATPAETWVSPVGLRNFPEFAEDLAAIKAETGTYADLEAHRVTTSQKQYRERLLQLAYADSLTVFTPNDWKTAPPKTTRGAKTLTLSLPGNWTSQGLADFDGMVYAYTTLRLPDSVNRESLILSLGRIDDADSVWVNGHFVGATDGYNTIRQYPISSQCLKGDSLYILVKITDFGGGGGFWGKNTPLGLTSGSAFIPLTQVNLVVGLDFAAQRVPLPFIQGNSPSLPSLLYQGMIAPLKGYSFKAVLWYQGESNVPRSVQYGRLLPALIEDWRVQFGKADLPFFVVQLPNFSTPTSGCQSFSAWAQLREAQRITARTLSQVHLCTTIDLGDAQDIHPTRKKEVGRRLGLLAESQLYNQLEKETTSPELESVDIQAGFVRLHFNHAKGLRTQGSDRIGGFCIAGADQVWHPAEARIDGEYILVSSPAVSRPLGVRYGWADNPTEANLFNEAGLPMTPFRTDDFPLGGKK